MRILAAAAAALAEDDGVSMNQIAQRAGVGAGTLYRNFPTRESLVLAVYEQDVEHLTASVQDLLDTQSPIDALRAWTTELIAAMRRKHSLGDALSAEAHRTVVEQSYGPVVAAIAQLLDAGKAEGTIRDDADPRDFLQFTAALWRTPTSPDDRSRPMLELLLDALSRRRD